MQHGPRGHREGHDHQDGGHDKHDHQHGGGEQQQHLGGHSGGHSYGYEDSFEKLIQDFGKRVGLRDMKLDQAGLCRVVLDETVNIDFELSADAESLYIYSAMPPMEAAAEQELIKALLNANYSLHRSCNCRFTFDENANEYVLCEVISRKGMHLDLLDQLLQNFARVATTWFANCKRGEFGGSPKPKDQEEIAGYAPSAGVPPPFV